MQTYQHLDGGIYFMLDCYFRLQNGESSDSKPSNPSKACYKSNSYSLVAIFTNSPLFFQCSKAWSLVYLHQGSNAHAGQHKSLGHYYADQTGLWHLYNYSVVI